MLVVVVTVGGVPVTVVEVVHVVAVLNRLVAAVGAVGVVGVGVGLVLCRVHGSNGTENMHALQYNDVNGRMLHRHDRQRMGSRRRMHHHGVDGAHGA